MRQPLRIAVRFCCLALTGLFLQIAMAQPRASEAQLKAAYLFNFSKFTTWPDTAFLSPDDPLQICVVGIHPFQNELDKLKNEKVHGRSLIIGFVREPASLEGCHLLFVSSSEAARAGRILGALAHKPVLTMSDIEGFASNGGMLELTTVDQRLRFKVNLDILREAQLSVSAQVLMLAVQIVHVESQGRPR